MADEKRIRLLIAEPHPLLLEALDLFFNEQVEVEVVAKAADTDQALPLVEQVQPDVVLISSSLRPMNLSTFIGRLCQESPATRVVVLSSNFDRVPAEKYMEAGAHQVVVKGIFASDLLGIIHQAYAKD